MIYQFAKVRLFEQTTKRKERNMGMSHIRGLATHIEGNWQRSCQQRDESSREAILLQGDVALAI